MHRVINFNDLLNNKEKVYVDGILCRKQIVDKSFLHVNNISLVVVIFHEFNPSIIITRLNKDIYLKHRIELNFEFEDA